MDLQEKRDIEVGPPLAVGDRLIFVVWERLQISTWKNHFIFGMLISPIYIVIVEHDLNYAFSLLEGTEVDLEELYVKNPSLKEKFYLIRNQFGKFTSLNTKDTSQATLEFSNNDESFEF
ncbi:MAG TPA: hypothetical protein VN739_01585 [Nitrososphaerales archaeon]|nr:hypothetical protein [Nitrososphaerales archaeon]